MFVSLARASIKIGLMEYCSGSATAVTVGFSLTKETIASRFKYALKERTTRPLYRWRFSLLKTHLHARHDRMVSECILNSTA